MFPPLDIRKDEQQELVSQAKALCAACPVFIQCEAASQRERFGVWAGELKEAPHVRRSRTSQREPAGV